MSCHLFRTILAIINNKNNNDNNNNEFFNRIKLQQLQSCCYQCCYHGDIAFVAGCIGDARNLLKVFLKATKQDWMTFKGMILRCIR